MYSAGEVSVFGIRAPVLTGEDGYAGAIIAFQSGLETKFDPHFGEQSCFLTRSEGGLRHPQGPEGSEDQPAEYWWYLTDERQSQGARGPTLMWVEFRIQDIRTPALDLWSGPGACSG